VFVTDNAKLNNAERRPTGRVRASVSSRLLRRGSPAASRVDRCAHQAADNAVVTTVSVHSTAATSVEGENNPTPSRAASTVARAPPLRPMIHLARSRGRARSSIEAGGWWGRATAGRAMARSMFIAARRECHSKRVETTVTLAMVPAGRQSGRSLPACHLIGG